MSKNNGKMKLLVTGASGFIGYEVARQLSVNGYRPRLMIRQAGDDCEICHFDADFVIADLRKPESLKEAVKGIDGILHLAARATFESYETLRPSILDGSLALMNTLDKPFCRFHLVPDILSGPVFQLVFVRYDLSVISTDPKFGQAVLIQDEYIQNKKLIFLCFS